MKVTLVFKVSPLEVPDSAIQVGFPTQNESMYFHIALSEVPLCNLQRATVSLS